MNYAEMSSFASRIAFAHLQNMPYLTVVETYFNLTGEDIDEEDGIKIHDMITSGEYY